MEESIYLLYKGTKYSINKKKFQEESTYALPSDNIINIYSVIDDISFIDESTIDDFVQFFNYHCVSFYGKSVMGLSKLADVFQVITLKEFTDIYKQRHTKDIIKDFFDSFDGTINLEYEELIASQLDNFLDQRELFDLPIPVIHRILSKHLQSHEITRDLLDFMFRYLNANGSDSSVLFNLIHKLDEDDEDYFIAKLYDEHRDNFNFAFLHPEQCKYLLCNVKISRDRIACLKYDIETLQQKVDRDREIHKDILKLIKNKIEEE